MSEEPAETVEETVEETPAVEETTAGEETEDLGALKRAYERQKEEAREAREELRRIREDEDAYRALGSEKFGFQFRDDDSEPLDDDEDDLEVDADPREQRLSALEQREQAREAAAREAAFNRDLDEIAENAKIELADEFDREWIANKAAEDPKGFDKGAVERAVLAFKEREEKREQALLQRLRSSKKPPRVPVAGLTATDVKNVAEMTTRERTAFMVDRARELQAES